MAGTATYVMHPSMAYYSFTSGTSPADEVVTVGFDPILVIGVIDADSTAPELVMSYNVSTFGDSFHLVNNTSAVVTAASPAKSSGISFSGRTFTVESAIQDASGENYFIVFGQ